jgi:hypothetical protein
MTSPDPVQQRLNDLDARLARVEEFAAAAQLMLIENLATVNAILDHLGAPPADRDRVPT